MGGLWEAAVKSCKYHLKRILGNCLLTYEEFLTILNQVEAFLNSRPLCQLTQSDHEITQVLTPAHFLIGRSMTSLPDYEYDNVPVSNLKHFYQLQQIYQNFWRAWSREYIGHLQERTKWRSCKGPALTKGTVVVVKEDRQPPCKWMLARIADTHPGKDGIVRVATLNLGHGYTIKRSFNKICPLPIDISI